MKPISRAELELEKIEGHPLKYSKIYCEFGMKCSRAGSYMRCATHLSVYCPFYVSFQEQKKYQDFSDNGGNIEE